MAREPLKTTKSPEKKVLIRNVVSGHEVKKPFKCDFCDNGFSRKYHLDIRGARTYGDMGTGPHQVLDKSMNI